MEIIIYTNETYIEILNITLPRFIEFLKPLNLRINVVTNKFVNTTGVDFEGVNVIETGVEHQGDGGHFRDSMLYALSKLQCEHFLFFLDDYILNSVVKKDNFDKSFNIFKEYNGDLLSFACLRFVSNQFLKVVNNDLKEYGIENGVLYEFDENYRHSFSVQPCLWKTSSFVELLSYNDRLTLHELDNSVIKNKKGNTRVLNDETYFHETNEQSKLDYNFKNLVIDLPPFSYNYDNRPLNTDYFIFDFGEIIRHGILMEHLTNSRHLVLSIIEQNPELKTKLKRFIY